jgi:hypothetical protein
MGDFVMGRKIASQKGASAVEFALILPLLMLILWGIIEFGLVLYNKQVITNASREGARAGIVAATARLIPGPTTPPPASSCVTSNPADPVSISCVVGQYCRNHLISFSTTLTNPQVAVSGYASDAAFGTNLTVTVSYTYQFLVFQNFTGFWGGTWSFSSIPLTAETVMKYE